MSAAYSRQSTVRALHQRCSPRRNNRPSARVPLASGHYRWDGKIMTRYFKGTLLTVVSLAFAGVAMAENPPATDDQQAAQGTTDQQTTSPSSASSPHQRKGTNERAAEASPTANAPTDTDPAASSTKHQREATGVRTAKSKAEKDQWMKDCVEQTQARTQDSSMSMEQAQKSCEEQMRRTERTGGG